MSAQCNAIGLHRQKHCLCFLYLGGSPQKPEISSSNGWTMHLIPSPPISHPALWDAPHKGGGKITEASSEFVCNHWCVSFPDMCIATAISLLMILICAMATYGAYKVIHYIWWRHEWGNLHNSIETKLEKLLSDNCFFTCLAENWG